MCSVYKQILGFLARLLGRWRGSHAMSRSGERPGPLKMKLTVALLTYNKVSGSGHARERMSGPWNFVRKKSWPHHCKDCSCKG